MKARLTTVTILLLIGSLLFIGKIRENASDRLQVTENDLPVFEITTEGTQEDISLYQWSTAKFSLWTASGKYASGDYEGIGFIKGRGNLSWLDEQKPYSILLNEKDSLLDMAVTKKYALISLCFDGSMMKNYITYKAGKSLTAIEYIPDCEFVDLYLNGEYRGVYLLTERIDVEPGKIQLHEASPYNIEGGYLLEKDVDAKINQGLDVWFASPYQANPHRDLFTVRCPEEVSKEMLNYLETYMQEVHEAIMDVSNDTYTRYVDVDSWVDFLIIQELTKNIDGNLKTSCFMLKHPNSDLLSMPTIWDFDLSYGGASWGNDSEYNNQWDCPNGMTTDGFIVINSSCPWYQALYARPEFQQKVKCRYAELRQVIIPEMYRLIEENQEPLLQVIMKRGYTQKEIEDYKTAVILLKQWIQGRVAWLDMQWLE